MQGVLETFENWHVHPVADHFTVAILIIAVLADLFASLFSTRLWLRYAALTLMIIGTAAAWASQVTGGWEAHRVWSAVKAGGGPAYATLEDHAELGDYLPWIFLILAVWRIGVQAFAFMAGTRAIYLIVAVLAAIALMYQGYMGGQLVYEYGIGTALYGLTSSPAVPQSEASGPATPIPTVYVPTAAATPEAVAPSATAAPSAAAAVASPATSAEPTASAAPATPAATPVPSPAAAASPAPST
ncbi:MAG TPA: DUF2231 domain-containing protein [Candidatus Binataceae bacterium]|nr:DUF2231 domain-containing protein [Candidatus Binataceae bacterium]